MFNLLIVISLRRGYIYFKQVFLYPSINYHNALCSLVPVQFGSYLNQIFHADNQYFETPNINEFY